MSRHRSFDEHAVIVAAKEVFWQRGVDATAISDLETATGLSRSSLYLAFETKRGLFEAALAEYFESFVQPLLGPLEARGAGLAEAAGFFASLGSLLHDPDAQRGCLMINTMSELAGRDPTFTPAAAGFAKRYRLAFSNALRGAAAQGLIERRAVTPRAHLLAVAAMGVWLAARADPGAAATTCDAIAGEIKSWARRPIARPRPSSRESRGR
jgi:AcrR family transcriptional regulator